MKYTNLQIIEAVASFQSLATAASVLGTSKDSIRDILLHEPAVSQYHKSGGRWDFACKRYLEQFCGPQDKNYDPAIEFELESEFQLL